MSEKRRGGGVIPKEEQAWRKRLAARVASGDCVVFANGKKLEGYWDVLTSDATMMDMVYFTKEEMENAGGDPMKAYLNRLEEICQTAPPLTREEVRELSAKMTIPIFRKALGDYWRED
jgi:hypothetical protein